MSSERSSQGRKGSKGQHSQASHDAPRRNGAGSGPQKETQRKIPRSGWFISSECQAEARKPDVEARKQGKDVHNKFINRQVTRAAEAGDISMLLEAIGAHAADMNGINLATAFHRVAKVSSAPGAPLAKREAVKNDPRFRALLADILQHISGHSQLLRRTSDGKAGARRADVPGEMPAQCLSIVAWSCATLRVHNEELFAQIAAIVESNLDRLKSFELSNLLWAYAKLHIAAPDLFSAATERVLHRREGEYTVQCLSTIAWCLATMQWRNAPLLASLAKELAAHANEAKPQEISTTLWAFAKNRHTKSMLFEVFGQAALADNKIQRFKLQELSNTAWAFATTGLQNIELFARIEQAALAKLPDMEPQGIANIMWAFAKLQVPLRTQLFVTLMNLTLAKQEQFKAQELSAVIWAAAQVCPDSPCFFGAAMRICIQRTAQFSVTAISNLVKTLSTVQTDDPSLYGAILRGNLECLQQLNPQAICNTLIGCFVAATSPTYAAHADEIGEATSHVCHHVASRISEFKQVEIEQISSALQNHRACLTAPSAEALELALLKRSRSSTLQSDAPDSEEKNDRNRQNSEDQDESNDLSWPTTTCSSWAGSLDSSADSLWAAPAPASCKVADATRTPSPRHLSIATALSNMATPTSCKYKQVDVNPAPKALHLASVLPLVAAPLGNTLASLAQGTPTKSAKPSNDIHPGLIAQLPDARSDFLYPPQFPPHGFDYMPWKIPVQFDASSAPWPMHQPTPVGNNAAAGGPTAEAMLVASFHAMLAATISGAAGANANCAFPAPKAGLSAPPGLQLNHHF